MGKHRLARRGAPSILGAITLSLLIQPSRADYLTAPYDYSARFSYVGGFETSPGTYARPINVNDISADQNGSVQTGPLPTVSASSSVNFLGGYHYDFSAAVYSSLSYYVELVGPNSATDIPVFTTATGSTNCVSNCSVRLDFRMRDNRGGIDVIDVKSVNVAQNAYFLPNIPYYVALYAEADSSGTLGGPYGSASATLDPMFFLDQFYSDQGYHLIFSEGIGNGPVGGVPELSTWAMMVLGFCGLGYMAFRRKQNGRALAAA